jgi:hypothetical protein
VAPIAEVETYELPEGGQRAGYGGDPDEPGTYHFEEQVWSENPTRVPREYDPGAAVLTDGEETYTHEALLAAAADAIDAVGLAPGDRVGVRSPLSDPRAVAAGVFAPLIVGGTTVLTDDHDVDVIVGRDETVTAETLALDDVELTASARE